MHPAERPARVTRRVFGTACVAAATLLSGCQSQQYREPPASDNPARLVGKDGTYINQVDGSDVRSAQTTNEAGGNEVTVTPGKRRVRAYTLAKGRRDPGLWTFTFNFEPGRTYDLSPSSDTILSLQVRDRTTGRVVEVN
jgi:hypothetical protein